jgi:hypothetical protein
VNLSALSRVTDCWLPVKPELWAWAALLGEARRASNDRARSHAADRGDSTNRAVDLAGAFGELLLYELVRNLPKSDQACRYLAERLYLPSGGAGVVGPDLKFIDDDTQGDVGVDCKSFFNLRYRYFAIYAKKHNELRGCCSFYFCLLTAAQ